MAVSITSRPDYGCAGSRLDVISLNPSQDTSLRHGRILSAPTLLFGGEIDVRVTADNDWEVGKEHFQPAPISSWAILILEPSRLSHRSSIPQSFEPFIRRLKACLEDSGHRTGWNQQKEPLRDPVVVTGTQCGSITKFLDKLRRMVPDPPAFIVAIMPKPNDDGYRELKCHCLTNLGVPLQAVEYSKAMVPRDDMLTSLALKINLKLGGANWVIPRTLLPHLNSLRDTIMVVGVSTYHLPEGSCGHSPAVGVGVVASYDRPLARFVSAAEVQLPQPDGRVVDLENILLKLLIRRRRAYPPIPSSATVQERFDMLQMIYPQIIFIYRSGLNADQYARAARKELVAIKSAMAAARNKFQETDAPLPSIAYVAIGSSKLKVRPVPVCMGDDFGNCPPGSVFDSGFASPDAFDFYLTNHSGRNSAPRLYTVLSHESDLLNSDVVQQVTYNLSFMIGTSLRPGSLPSPAHYAALVCKSIRHLWEPGFDPSSVLAISSVDERLAVLKRKLRPVSCMHDYKMWFS